MVVYNIDEIPDVFITPHFYDDKFVYRMEQFYGEENRKTIRTIDLRNDKLIIYGVEIQESMFGKLRESLVVRPKAGIVYVNCNGACYFLIAGKGCYRPIDNVIFDWSPYGVTIPNSVNDLLRKQLELKDREMDRVNQLLCSSRKEVDVLKGQLSTCEKNQHDMGMKLQEVCTQLSLIDFELEIYKIESESYKKEILELQDQVSTYIEDNENMEIELRKLRDQLSSTNSEYQATMRELESSKKMTLELNELLSSCKIERQKVEDHISLMHSQLEDTQTQLKSSNESVKELEDQLSSCRKECEDTKTELRKIQDELSLVKFKFDKERQVMEEELQKVQGELFLAMQDLRSTKIQFASLEKSAYDHLSSIEFEVESTNHKVDQLLTSMLWNVNDRCNFSQPTRSLEDARCQDSFLPLEELPNASACTLLVTCEVCNSIDRSAVLSLSEDNADTCQMD